jgi:hypothetical protein
MLFSKVLSLFRRRRSLGTHRASGSGTSRRVRLHCEQLEDRLAPAGTIRVVAYNMEADIDGDTTPLPGFYQVLEGIGEESLQGDVQPLDILVLEETTSNSTTVAPIVTNLNDYYNGAAVYAQSPYQATESGNDPSDGNGPNAMVYNTSTLNLLASVGVGTPEGSTNGEYRQVVRYEFQPVGDSGTTGIFYVYVSHMKSGTTSADATDRGEEATIIRNDEATLPANASVLYAGDLNSVPPEAEFTNFTASGQGEAYDPANFSTSVQYYSESATDLRYRDDYQLMTSTVLNDTGAINYVSGTLHSFGNNGTTPSGGSVDSGSDTALNGDLVQDGGPFISASSLYTDLTTASDHLPVVADYTLGSQSPATTTTTVMSTPASPITQGASITFTGAVSGSPSVGTMTFYAGPGLTNPIGSPVNVVNGSATSPATTTLPVGTDTVTAVYSGGTGFAGSQGTESVVVNAATATTVTSTPASPITQGASIIFTGTVSGSPSVGTVTFYAGPGLTNQIGAPVNVVNGTATSAATTTLRAGTDTITAVYSGGTGFAGSQGTESVVVNALTTTTVSSTPASPITLGTSITFTAAISGNPGAGTVTFYAGPGLTNQIGSTVNVVSGSATSAATTGLSVGSNTITAVYSGGTGFAGSQGTETVVVNAAASTFQVSATSVLAGDNGFLLTFNASYTLTAAFNLYTGDIGGILGPRDVQITGPNGATFGGAAADTMRFNAVPVDSTDLELVLTGLNHVAAAPVLAPGSYTVTLDGGSSDPAVERLSDGAFLDGNGDGVIEAADNYTTTLNVAAIPATTAVVSIGDLVAGPGQTLTVPLVLSGGVGSVSDTTSVDLTIAPPADGAYTVTGFAVNNSIAGVTAAFNPATGMLTMSSSSAFAATDNPLLLGNFTFAVDGLGNPGAAPGTDTKTPIDITVTSVTDHAFNPKPFVGVDAFHVSAYAGNVVAPIGVYTAADVSQIQSLIVGLTKGVALYPNVDPNLLADVNDDGIVSSADVSNLQLRIIGATSSIPPLPAGASGVAVNGADPVLFVGTTFTPDGQPADLGSLTPGSTVVVPLSVYVSAKDGVNVSAADTTFSFDPQVFALDGVTAGAIADGSLGGQPFTIAFQEIGPGEVNVTGSSSVGPNLMYGQTATLFLVRLTVRVDAPGGATAFNLQSAEGSFETELQDNLGRNLVLAPAPENRAGDEVDGAFTIQRARIPLGTVPIAFHGAAPQYQLGAKGPSALFVFLQLGSSVGGTGTPENNNDLLVDTPSLGLLLELPNADLGKPSRTTSPQAKCQGIGDELPSTVSDREISDQAED